MKNSRTSDTYTINFNINHQLNGNLIAINNNVEIPFNIKRIYYLYDIPFNSLRGGHAHINLQQIIIPLSGSFDLIIKDGILEKNYNLTQPNVGVYLPAGLWRELVNFSSGSICLVLVSEEYDENDYIRDFDEYLIRKKWKKF